MSEQPTRWCASFDLRWSPMLTYGARRVDLLDWLDEHLDVVEFFENEDGNIGIGIESPTRRMLISELGVTFMLRSPTAEAVDFNEALSGVLTKLRPRGLRVGTYRSVWSAPIDIEYQRARRALALRATGPAAEVADAYDCAVLFDANLASGHAQVDFGIVDDGELIDRLLHPDMSRLTSHRHVLSTVPNAIPGELPPASVFLDVLWHAHGGQADYVTHVSEVSELLSRVENDIAGVVESLRAGV